MNEIAFAVGKSLTGVVKSLTSEDVPIKLADKKNPHAVALGRLGGLKGGKARATKLSAKKRTEIASKAARTRWSNKG